MQCTVQCSHHNAILHSALTGEKIKAAIDFQSRECETEVSNTNRSKYSLSKNSTTPTSLMQFNLEAHEQSLDTFITTLETTITALQVSILH